MKLIDLSTEPRQNPASDSDTLTAVSDPDLLDAWTQDRHTASLDALVKRYSVMVLSVCRRRCRNEADAEDAFQSTFLYLARNGKKIRHPERLAGWLHRVAQRAAVATLKSTDRETEPMVDPPADPDDPLHRLTQRHEAIVLDEELADLPAQYRSAIVMHVYEGHSIGMLAEHFGTTAGSIRGRLQRGKRMLAQRLRRRGVVPVIAYAAASSWTVSEAHATTACEAFADAVSIGELPDPPIGTPLLESLLAQGIRLMPSLYTAGGLLGGSALVALLLMTNGTHGQTRSSTNEISFPPSAVEKVDENRVMIVGQAVNADANAKSGNHQGGAKPGGTVIAPHGGTTARVSLGGQLIWKEKIVVPRPSSKLANRLFEALDREEDMRIDTTLAELPSVLQNLFRIPAELDDRGVKFSEQSIKQRIEFDELSIPLGTGLHRMLSPLGLKAVVQDEGLVITANMGALVHKGIGSTRWTNIDERAAEYIAEKLEEECSVEFVELPLVSAMAEISERNQLPVLINSRALEEIGLSDEEPVTLSLNQVKLRNVLGMLLNKLDLTYTIQGESLVITTLEEEETSLLTRIYWLEGTGLPAGNFQSILNTIQTSITPETWEALGGPSTMTPLASVRPALLVSSSYYVHEDLEQFFDVLRETHFGRDPVTEPVQVPANVGYGGPQQFGGGGFGGGGGFF